MVCRSLTCPRANEHITKSTVELERGRAPQLAVASLPRASRLLAATWSIAVEVSIPIPDTPPRDMSFLSHRPVPQAKSRTNLPLRSGIRGDRNRSSRARRGFGLSSYVGAQRL